MDFAQNIGLKGACLEPIVSWQSDNARNTRLVGMCGTFWNALRAQGISDHMIWMLSTLYEDQSGEVRGKWGAAIFP